MSARYVVTHRTTYSYDEDVTDSLGIAHLVPRSLPWQEVGSATVTVDPAPGDLAHDTDHYGNTATYFQVTRGHRRLEITASSEVAVAAPSYDEAALGAPWEQARPLVVPRVPGAWRATDFALGSDQVERTVEAHAYAAQSLRPGRAVGEAARDLMHRIHADFEYDQKATTVTSTVPEILAKRAGVCQDFAHLTIACLRSHGLAARYVSGYLSTDPPPGRQRVVGADASHAWVAVWAPAPDGASDGEWLALDPTNDQPANDRYVTVAWGRDYGDVTPVKGVIFTEAKRSTLRVSVDVAPVTPSS
ncbi:MULTISPECIES: transglutaminase family protein [unclassified Nocardioides]|uniref:transglutaminase family protein n=1 Tax=unclassified Nocardioides TaxID=2615069 RepID=UPI0030151C0D